MGMRGWLWMLGMVLCSGCADRGEATARAVFDRYQDALFAGDRNELWGLLSRSSRPVLSQLPLERVGKRQPLVFVCATAQDPEVVIEMRDPNHDGREARLVLVREDGELLVDLLATTAFHHEIRGRNPARPPAAIR